MFQASGDAQGLTDSKAPSASDVRVFFVGLLPLLVNLV